MVKLVVLQVFGTGLLAIRLGGFLETHVISSKAFSRREFLTTTNSKI